VTESTHDATPLDCLRHIIAPMRSVLVAFSGGIDSTLVLKVAHEQLAKAVVAVTAVSPTLPAMELELTQQLCQDIGVRHVLHQTDQLQDEEFVRNTASRCYRCKRDLYDGIVPLAKRLDLSWICDGTHVDDTVEDRPGLRAAREYGIRSPLLEAAMGKTDIRAAARTLGLTNWDKPAAACLSSRIPRGEIITFDRLQRVEQAEAFLDGEGFRQVRVRDHSGKARVEVGQDELCRLFDPVTRDRIIDALINLGFEEVALDPAGYRAGNTNRST
jgi:pyridinium-3,5-biscarboxylic acid mononucleotide sulfurtransferase